MADPVQISPVAQRPIATPVAAQASSAAARRADNDGDGKTGAAALNDGDAAARAATAQVKSVGKLLDVKA
jgi:hypothetical protein